MTRALKMALPGVLAAALVATAAAPPGPPTKPFANRAPDQLDYLFTASDRPVLIRVHLRAGDKPYAAVWEAFMDKLFAWFDKDNDGSLSGAEAARLMPAQNLNFQLQGSIGAGGNQTAPFASLDTNKDGKVSKEEFRAFYRNGGVSPLRFSNNNAQAQNAKQVNDSIYRRLGRAPKGKLTKADASKLPSLLAKFDENEDEMLTSAELNADGDSPGIYGEVVFARQAMPRPVAGDPGLFEIQPNYTAATLVQQLAARYDRNKDGQLTRDEAGLDKEEFDKLDANKDGKLSATEAEGFFYREPDLVFRARVGPPGSGVMGLLARTGLFGKTQRAEVLNDKKLPPALAKKVKKVDADTLSFDLGDARFSFAASEGTTANRLQGVKQFYLQQFDAVADKNGVVERGKENDGNRFIMQLFTQADKNADGKLARKEFSEWLDLIESGSNAFVTVQVNDSGRNLFNVIDTNGDGRLTIREMRTAWARMGPLCKDGKALAQTDLPRTLRIQMTQGQFFDQRVFFNPFGQQQAAPPRAKVGSVPEWFTKMDRNADGDLSPREWLGTDEDFRAIDADGDGLISADEARAYEAKKGKQPATKTEVKKAAPKK